MTVQVGKTQHRFGTSETMRTNEGLTVGQLMEFLKDRSPDTKFMVSIDDAYDARYICTGQTFRVIKYDDTPGGMPAAVYLEIERD